jgi:hypothetical protein
MVISMVISTNNYLNFRALSVQFFALVADAELNHTVLRMIQRAKPRRRNSL